MTDFVNSLLCRRVNAKRFRPSHVAEIGVWHPETSNVIKYIHDGIRTTLVEPDPDSILLIKSVFGHKDNVTLYEVAVCDFNGMVDLYKRESSTFVSFLTSSPALVNDDCDTQQAEKTTVRAILFTEIDDGTIDLISIDTEGSEWFVIKNMRSRPTVISLETHGGIYVNPFLEELLDWMHENNYVLWYRDKSDSVFVLLNTIPVSFLDRINLLMSSLTIAARTWKKKLGKIVKKKFMPS